MEEPMVAALAGDMARWGEENRSEVHCLTECPSLMSTPDAWQLWVLVVLYAALAVGSVVILFRGNHHRWSSFRNNFLRLQCVISLFRCLLFVVHISFSHFTLILFVYMLPIYLQFVTFSLLIVFLIRCLLIMQGRSHLVNYYIYPSYAVLAVLLFAGMIALSYFANRRYFKPKKDGFDHSLSFYGFAVFGVLTICVAVVGFKTHRLLMRIVLSETRRRKVLGVSYMGVVYFFVFLARTIWSLTYAFNKNILQRYLNDLQHKNYRHYYTALFVFYVIFEILPMVCLLRAFWLWVPKDKYPFNSTFEAESVNTALVGSGRRKATSKTPLLPT